jgi:hypothetical protein
MSTSELMQVIGKTGLLAADGLNVSVRIVDARGPNWGRIDYQVTPVSGQGTIWVDANRVKIQNESEV